MKKHVHIVGNLGNMGKRYEAICKYLGHTVTGHDKYFQPKNELKNVDRIIIATPTECHIDDIGEYSKFGKPILCEKPFTKDIERLLVLEKFLEANGTRDLVSMVNQYQYLAPYGSGATYYDYFKTGKDGLAWDCINLRGLSEKEPQIYNTSPIWECILNGKRLSIADMDLAYVEMIRLWIDAPTSNWKYLKEAHGKVDLWIKKNAQNAEN